MRIECITTAGGTTCKIYRGSAPEQERVVALVVELHKAGTCIVVGATRAEPDLVFTIGPVHRLLERRFTHEMAALQRAEEASQTSPTSTPQ